MKETVKKFIRYHQIKAWYETHERLLIPGTLVLGTLADALTFTSLDVATSFIILGIYFFFAGIAIVFLDAYDDHHIPVRPGAVRYLRLSAPLVIQFTFGAMLSASLIFYFFSGSVFVSWPIIAALVFLMVSNDVFRKYYLRPSVQISVYFFILFSLISILLPFVFRSTSPWIFVLSAAASVVLMSAYILCLFRIIPRLREARWRLATTIALITLTMNALYFWNIIPPIPLAVRDRAVAHDIKRSGSSYTLTVEEETFFDRLMPGQTVHTNGKLFVYTAIFAPKDLAAAIVHHWQYFSETEQRWISKDRLTFDIRGGAETGYRGYSFKSSVSPGAWRVDVETTRGQVLGRVRFRVVEDSTAPMLKTVIK